jgi:hypothetical protein
MTVQESELHTSADDRRYRHIPFDPALIREFLRGRDIASVALLPAGRTNSNYKLALSDGQRCVLRLYNRGSPERDAYVMRLLRGLVPVPEELARGETWSLFAFIDGALLSDSPADSGTAAQALARISTVRFESAGWINADGTVSPFSFEGGGGFVEGLLDRPDVCAWLDGGMISAIRTLHRREAARLAEIGTESRLVHGDFNPTNILVHDGAVAAILDWEWSHSGSPYMDIGNLLRNTDPVYQGEIRRGLEAGGMCLPADWRQRAELIDLSSHMEFLTSDRSDAFKRQCVGRIRRCLALFGVGT